MTTTEFAPITLNGEPVVTWHMTHLIAVNERLYEQEYAASAECSCRRCLLHEDFGGCLVADAMYGLVEFMINPLVGKADWA